jgi:hypothetical protein
VKNVAQKKVPTQTSVAVCEGVKSPYTLTNCQQERRDSHTGDEAVPLEVLKHNHFESKYEVTIRSLKPAPFYLLSSKGQMTQPTHLSPPSQFVSVFRQLQSADRTQPQIVACESDHSDSSRRDSFPFQQIIPPPPPHLLPPPDSPIQSSSHEPVSPQITSTHAQ